MIEPHPIGDVKFPTGQVVGCDPLTSSDGVEPFMVGVTPGTHPPRAWVTVLYRDGAEQQRRAAALRLVILDEPTVRWEPTLMAGNDPSALGENEFFGYGVDADTGTLADVTAVRALVGWNYAQVEDVYIPAQIPEWPVQGAAGVVTDGPSGANVILGSSGWGTKAYPTFVGNAAPGEVSSFVTDLMVAPAG